MTSAATSPTLNAAQLVYLALQTGETPAANTTYRRLLARYRAEEAFRSTVQEVCEGLQLRVIDVSAGGMVLTPASSGSRFALRMPDIRGANRDRSPEMRASLVLAHVAVAAALYPFAHQLEDDSYVPPPVTLDLCCDTLMVLARQLDSAVDPDVEFSADLTPGYRHLNSLQRDLPHDAKRTSTTTALGITQAALTNMEAHGLVRLDRPSSDEAKAGWGATVRLRAQLRERALERLYTLAQESAQASHLAAARSAEQAATAAQSTRPEESTPAPDTGA